MPTLNGGGDVSSDLITSIGFHTVYLLNPATNGNISILGSSFTGSIDNISVKEYTAADMDVTRATAATRVDEAGLVNYAEIIGDEEITNGDFATDSDWDKTGTWSIESNYATSNGNGTTQYLGQDVGIVNGRTYKITYTVLSNSLDADRLLMSGTSSFASTQIPSAIGKNKVYLTAITSSPSSGYDVRIANSATNSSGTIKIDNISVKEVTRDNVPRIDYTGGGCPHILAEPESTNHCTFSEQPSVWTSSTGVTVTANATTSPEGTANASTVVNTATNAFVRNAFLYTSTDASLNVTTSFFLKYTNNQWVSLKPNFFTGGSNSKTWFDIQNGVLGTNDNVSSSIVDFGNGWYRCSVTHQIAPATDTSGFVFIYAVDNDNSTTQVIGQGFAAFGSQGEQLSYSTSYIPTSGSTVTRNQDIFTRDGIGSLINSTEGVLFVEMAAFSDTGTVRLALSDGTNSNNIYIELGSSYISSVGRLSAVNQFALFSNQTTTDYNKIAVKFKANDFALWINGSEVSVDNSGGTYLSGTLTQLVLNRGDGNDALFGKVKQLQVYKTALTDTQLAALTS